MTARVMQGNGYYPSPQETESGSDGDATLRMQAVLPWKRRPGTLWERVRDGE